jgi:5-methylcytosine-specific restriction endonuclease McrA
MAGALRRACATIGCRNTTTKGSTCPACTRHTDAARRSAAARGYDREWDTLRRRFRWALLKAGIAPVCGARLPGARPAPASECWTAGALIDDTRHRLRFGKGLDTDHIIPHRGDRVLFRDLLNLQLLCHREHSAKTLREQAHG